MRVEKLSGYRFVNVSIKANERVNESERMVEKNNVQGRENKEVISWCIPKPLTANQTHLHVYTGYFRRPFFSINIERRDIDVDMYICVFSSQIYGT